MSRRKYDEGHTVRSTTETKKVEIDRKTHKLKDELAGRNILPVLLEDGTGVDLLRGRTEECKLVIDPVGIVSILIDTKEGESL